MLQIFSIEPMSERIGFDTDRFGSIEHQSVIVDCDRDSIMAFPGNTVSKQCPEPLTDRSTFEGIEHQSIPFATMKPFDKNLVGAWDVT